MTQDEILTLVQQILEEFSSLPPDIQIEVFTMLDKEYKAKHGDTSTDKKSADASVTESPVSVSQSPAIVKPTPEQMMMDQMI